MIKTLMLLYLFFLSAPIFAQNTEFDLQIDKTQETIGDIRYTGYITSFDIPKEELQRTWWRYSKSIGIVENMKTHYIVRIPATEKGFSSVSVIEKTKTKGNSSQLFLAILDQTNNTYKAQVEELLLEFKVNYYADIVEKKIAGKENELAEVSTRYQNLLLQSGKGTEIPKEQESNLLEDINKLSYELEMLKRSLTDIR